MKLENAKTAVLLMAYGTPSNTQEILPYYTDIRRGRAPTDEQLTDLVARYDAIGGISPLAARTEAQRDALAHALDSLLPGHFDVQLGLKHAAPMIETAVEDFAQQGYKKIIALVLAPHFSSYSIGQYMKRATEAAKPHGVEVVGITSWAVESAFVDFIAAEMTAKLATMPARTHVFFTAHSLPQSIIDKGDPYPTEVHATATAVARQIGLVEHQDWNIAWQSAGRTPEPWIGPDILLAIDDIAARKSADGVLVSAVGFVADHLEVLYDLDIQAARHADKLGLLFSRTACVNDESSVMSALAQRVIDTSSGLAAS